MTFGLGIGGLLALLVGWTVLHAAMVREGTRVFNGEPPAASGVLAAVFVTPLVVFVVGLGVGCVGAVLPFFVSLPLSLLVAVGVRAACYASFLRLPGRGALGMAVGVTLVSWMLAAVLGGTVMTAAWMMGALG
ncbi:MAG: hypothetical protein H6738_18555 [Alphaproteobacteria bacterium]|nr:hypothetical protein [Alphaproteobacteria bacterium]